MLRATACMWQGASVPPWWHFLGRAYQHHPADDGDQNARGKYAAPLLRGNARRAFLAVVGFREREHGSQVDDASGSPLSERRRQQPSLLVATAKDVNPLAIATGDRCGRRFLRSRGCLELRCVGRQVTLF